MKENQILVIIKEPGKDPVVEPLFDNTLEAFQEAVGGYIETYPLAEGVCIICNEDGKLLGLPYNMSIFREDFVGTLVAVGTKGEEFASLKASQVPALLSIFRG